MTVQRAMRSDAARNREDLLRVATLAFHRDGLTVPMAAIAAEAGVGVATLYRHFADREALLAELTHRSFEQVLRNAVDGEQHGASPLDALRLFVEAAISQRHELVLPLHGGPAVSAPATRRVRTQVHRTLGRILERGVAEGSIRPGVHPLDVVAFGSMVSQPQPATIEWDETCRRLLDTFLRGMAGSGPR